MQVERVQEYLSAYLQLHFLIFLTSKIIVLLCRYVQAASFAKFHCKANNQGNCVDKQRLKSFGNC